MCLQILEAARFYITWKDVIGHKFALKLKIFIKVVLEGSKRMSWGHTNTFTHSMLPASLLLSSVPLFNSLCEGDLTRTA